LPYAYDVPGVSESTAIQAAEVLLDPSGKLTLQEVQSRAEWKPLRGLNFGFEDSTVWVRFLVRNKTKVDRSLLLEQGYPLIQNFDFFLVSGGSVVQSFSLGKSKAFKERSVNHRNFVIPFEISASSERWVYLAVQSSGTVRTPLTLHSPASFVESTVRQTVALGGYFGIILALAAFNLFLFFSVRDVTYLYYVLYALSFAVLQASLNGFAYQYLWPDFVEWNNVTVPIFLGVSLVFLTHFTRRYLETKKSSPSADLVLSLLSLAFGSISVFGVLYYGRDINRMCSIAVTGAPLLLLPIAVVRYRQGFSAAVYYLLAFAAFFAGSVAVASKDLGLLPMGFFTIYGMHIGAASEMLLFSLGLASRLKTLKEEKLVSEFSAIETLQKLKINEAELERKRSLSVLAEQVAHDIRSPLTALQMITGQSHSLPEEERVVARSALASINDIINNLTVTKPISELNHPNTEGADEPLETYLLSSVINALVSEKRAQFRNRVGIIISAEMPSSSYGHFARFDVSGFRRAISNIINNSVDSIVGSGQVTISTKSDEHTVVIEVSDNGKGIPENLLPMVGVRGFSFAKKGGKGLGLHAASRAVSSWGGSMTVQSTPGNGTTVKIELPGTRPPPWYVPALVLAQGSTVVALDDDQSIHHLWRKRLTEPGVQSGGIDFVSCTHLVQMEERVSQGAHEGTTFLVDFELIDQGATGLDMIERLGIASNAILVTSRFEERLVVERCAELGVRMIPKGLASVVPIRIERAPRNSNRQYVLIDDCEFVRAAWEISANRDGKPLTTFASVEQFLAKMDDFPVRHTILFIDSNLGTRIRGETSAKTLRELGFEEVHLTTGMNPSGFSHLWWLSSVRGKEPPVFG
jgi:signal transduction histidine kinase